MTVFLVHVRDPQFYAIPSKKRAKNGRLRVMGFPPIGIMSLSSVLKRAGHDCVMSAPPPLQARALPRADTQAPPPVHPPHAAPRRDLPRREAVSGKEEGVHGGGGDLACGRACGTQERRSGLDAARGRGPRARDPLVSRRACSYPGGGRSRVRAVTSPAA